MSRGLVLSHRSGRGAAVASWRGANPPGSSACGWLIRARTEEAPGRRCLAPGFPVVLGTAVLLAAVLSALAACAESYPC